MEKLINIKKYSDTHFEYNLSEAGQKCDFLQFLINVSNFSWRKSPEDITREDNENNNLHLVSKLCAIGHLFQPYKDPSKVRAVAAVNGTHNPQSRNGKSLFCNILTSSMASVKISGKSRHLMDDAFIWQCIDEKIKLVLIDDFNPANGIECFFNCITGDWAINRKCERRICIPYNQSPRLLINTNEPFEDQSPSVESRFWYLGFSDYYNEAHRPMHDFENIFIQEWDVEQFQLLNRLYVECMQLFLELGEIINVKRSIT